MKNIISVAFVFLLVNLSWAQTDGLSYQAVIIDNNPQEIPGIDVTGNYLSEGEISLLFSIYNSSNVTEFQEIQSTITDKFGMIDLIIGQGETTPMSAGEFNEISWDGTPKQLAVAISYNGSDYQEFSKQELLFAPYAYHRNITATGTLDVDGATTLNSTLTVENQSLTYLTGDLQVDGVSNLNSELNVLNQSPSYLSGELTVDGDAHFNGDSYFNTITVENQSTLNGPLLVEGVADFNNELNVLQGNPTSLSGNLTVDGVSLFNDDAIFQDILVQNTSNLNGTLNVNNGSPTNLSGSLNVTGASNLNGVLNANAASYLNGQVTINANVNGSQTAYGSYPLRVQGSNQGVAIKLDGSETSSNNFLTFYDGFGNIHGAIEGQTMSQLHSSFRFIWDVVMGGLEQAFVAAEGIACGSQLDFAEAGVMLANNITLGAQWVELTNNYEANVGVYFRSGGADYAEWLEREVASQKMEAAQVVGVKAGKISFNTTSADHVLVISTNPIVLGNQPKSGNADNYEKVAFLGQVPVRVIGIVDEGDYIIPTGSNDGIARAVKSSELSTSDFKNIIGVAWESSVKEGLKLINVAIGLTTNDLAAKVASLEDELNDLRQEMDELKALVSGRTVESVEVDSPIASVTEASPRPISWKANSNSVLMSDEDFKVWLDTYGEIFELRMNLLKKDFQEKSIEYQQFDEIKLIVDHPIEALQKMRSGEFMASLWESFENRYLHE